MLCYGHAIEAEELDCPVCHPCERTLADLIIKEVDRIRHMQGYNEDNASQWLGPTLHCIEDAAIAIRVRVNLRQ